MRTLGLAWIGLALATSSPASAEGPRPPKFLIEFGWDEPDTGFLRAHLAEMERTPFDGCVFHVDARAAADGKPASLTWGGWGRRTFTADDVKAARDDLGALRPARFTRNFLRFNTAPGDVDWFDDFGPIVANARVAASLAREGRCAGVLLDVEQYEGHLFDLIRQRDAKAKGWEAYATQARRRGREVMEAMQAGFPGLTVLLTFGHTLPWSESERGKTPLAETPYGLLAPFLDGMVDAAKEGAKIVDGYELSYGYRTPGQFDQARAAIKSGVVPIVTDREAYNRFVSAGFGLWLDYDWRTKGWDTADPSKNYFTPEGFEASVRAALERSDEYVWIYTETPRWWSPGGGPVKLPGAYDRALRGAKAAAVGR